MKIQFSCGHWSTDIENIGTPVALKRQDIDHDGWKNVVHYATYCSLCYTAACLNNEVLFTDEEEMNWFRGEK